MVRLNAKGMERINEISNKYRFQDTFEIEQDDAYDFCAALLRCADLGLNIDAEDKAFITDVRDRLASG